MQCSLCLRAYQLLSVDLRFCFFKLTAFSLGSNKLGHESVQALGTFLTGNTTLTALVSVYVFRTCVTMSCMHGFVGVLRHTHDFFLDFGTTILGQKE